VFIHVSYWITLRTDLVHFVEILEIGYGESQKSRRLCWIREGEELELHLPTISEMISMP